MEEAAELGNYLPLLNRDVATPKDGALDTSFLV